MSKAKLVVVPFNDDDEYGRTTGDSILHIGYHFPYKKGMTLADIRTKGLKLIMTRWAETDMWDDEEAFAKEYNLNITGGWVVKKSIVNLLESTHGKTYNDSDSCIQGYDKSIVESASKQVIE